ncbi:hypothetical protein D3C72_2143470 [compost metagenome]
MMTVINIIYLLIINSSYFVVSEEKVYIREIIYSYHPHITLGNIAITSILINLFLGLVYLIIVLVEKKIKKANV